MDSKIPPTVDAIGQMHFTGNVIDHRWYKSITLPDGKADLIAINILAEIVYWYRPRILRDETTGEILSVEKRFKADTLQRDYESFAQQFGLGKRQVREAIIRLEEIGLIRRDLRTIETGGSKIGNVLYIHLDPLALQRHTYGATTPEALALQRQSCGATAPELSPSSAIPVAPQRQTYTENTPATTSKTTTTKGEEGQPAAQPQLSSPPSPPSDFDSEQNILALAQAIAETCGLSPVALAAMTGKGKAKWTEILGYAQQFATLALPSDWCDHPAQAGPITADHIRLFRDWWQHTKPIGNSADDLPHPIQVFQRLSTRDAIAWITARQSRDAEPTVVPSPPPPVAPSVHPPHPPTPSPAATALWAQVLAEMQLSLPRATYDAWLRNTTPVALDDANLTIIVPTPAAQEWLTLRMNGALAQRVQRLAGRPLAIHYILPSNTSDL